MLRGCPAVLEIVHESGNISGEGQDGLAPEVRHMAAWSFQAFPRKAHVDSISLTSDS